MNFILFCMATIGLTDIVLESNLFLPVRNSLKSFLTSNIYEVFQCHQCMGTWVGFLIGYLLLPHNFATVLACGFAGSFLASWGDLIHKFIWAHTMANTGVDIDTGESETPQSEELDKDHG
jgi:hypothetical protein